MRTTECEVDEAGVSSSFMVSTLELNDEFSKFRNSRRIRKSPALMCALTTSFVPVNQVPPYTRVILRFRILLLLYRRQFEHAFHVAGVIKCANAYIVGENISVRLGGVNASRT